MYISGFTVDGAILDLDGTVLDSMLVWDRITDNFYKSRGLEMSEREARFFRNSTLPESMAYIKETYSLPQSHEEITKEFLNMIYEAYAYELSAKPYACEFIRKMHENGVKISVATSTFDKCCYAALKRLDVEKYISAYTFSNEVKQNKSKPDIYLLAAEKIGIMPQKCMVFEDLYIGIKSAKSGGFLTCGVSDTMNEIHKDDMKRDADIYINTWKELL